MALRLQRLGITRVRPLDGGIAQWMALGFAVRPLPAPAIPALDSSSP